MDDVARIRRRRPPPLVLREARVSPTFASGVEVVARILEARYGEPLSDEPEPDGLLGFQRDAARRARAILVRRGGVLIADSVGLGKTHVALELLTPAFQQRSRVALVAPAALRRHWREAAAGRGEFDWISYARLSRGLAATRDSHGAYDFVVFDEAHALRNPTTRRYANAVALARGAQLVLLTATPVNNSTWDLYHLLRLFCGDRDFLDVGVPSLRTAFAEAEASCLLGSAPALQPVLRAVMIRRTRGSILGAREASRGRSSAPVGLSFPDQQPPTPVYYAFGSGDSPHMLDVVGEALLRLTFPVHTSPEPAPVELLRRSLFKRLESSLHAFRRSIASYDALLRRATDALAHGLLVRAGDAFARAGGEAQLTLDAMLYEPAPRSELDAMGAALDAERHILGRIQAQTAVGGDPKLDVLEALLRDRLAGRRVVVFTQFRDTARYLHERLGRHFRIGLIDGAGAILGGAPVDRASVVRRFAPAANGAPQPPPREAIDVLVATDVLSEGFNLQDASVVVSYDLPWNPIRLVQRVGRVDRLGSPHASVASFHFLPGDLERYLGLVERIARKTGAIEATVGADMPVLHTDLVRSIDRRDASLFARLDPEALDERLRRLFRRLPRPSGGSRFGVAFVRHVDASHEAPTGMVAARVGGRVEWIAVRNGAPCRDDEFCAGLLEAAAEAAGAAGSLHDRRIDRLLAAARAGIARSVGLAAAAPLLPGNGRAAQLGRRILALAAELPGGPGPDVCRRIENCLGRLVSLADTDLVRLPRVSDSPPGRQLAELLDAVEAASSRPPEARAAPGHEANDLTVTLIGAVLALPPDR